MTGTFNFEDRAGGKHQLTTEELTELLREPAKFQLFASDHLALAERRRIETELGGLFQQ